MHFTSTALRFRLAGLRARLVTYGHYWNRVLGEMERGTLTNLRGRMFEFGYDYLAVTRSADEPAAYVEITKFVSKFRQLCVISRAFAHCAFDRGNVRHLRSDVEMDKFQAMRKPGIL